LLTSLGAIVPSMAMYLHMMGPLGKPSLEDDEREAALRKDAYLVCFGLLAFLNCVGQLLLMSFALLRQWGAADAIFIGSSALLLNLTLFGSVPTLYVSWRVERLPNE
jgi:hypothetical protein